MSELCHKLFLRDFRVISGCGEPDRRFRVASTRVHRAREIRQACGGSVVLARRTCETRTVKGMNAHVRKFVTVMYIEDIYHGRTVRR